KEPPVVEPVEVKDHVTPEFDKSPVTIGVSESFCVTVSPPRKGVKVTTTLLVVVVEELLQPARVTIPTKIKTKETTDWAREQKGQDGFSGKAPFSQFRIGTLTSQTAWR